MRSPGLAAAVIAGALFVLLVRPALADEAELPRALLDTTYVPPTGRTLAVPAGGDFQAALDAALPGDVITLEAGATFTGPFVLPKKEGSGWIIVRTSAPDSSLPPPGTRVDPSYAAVMPKLVVPPEVIAGLITAPGAHHFRFIGIEVEPAAGAFVQNLIVLSVLTPGDENPHHLTIDRCYVHGDPVVGGRRGIVLNSSSSAVIDSYLADFKQVGADSEAIMGWNGPGPFRIVNNYLEAASVNLLFGGADPTIPDLVPSDIEIRHNYFGKPLAWRIEDPGYAGTPWTVKNLLTLKNARRVLIDGNLFEHNWLQEQKGTAIIFTVRNQDGTAPWSTVEDVTFTNNIVRHTGSAIGMHGWDDNFPSQPTKRILIRNNLFDDVSGARWGGAGRLFEANKGIEDLVIDHNTGFQDGAILRAEGNGTAAVSTLAGAQAMFTFTGTSVNWIGFRGPQTGIARVYLDGGFVTAVDTFSPTEEVQAVVFTASGLADASHTLTIEVTGLKNAASTDVFIVVDAFDASLSSPAPTVTRFQETDPSVTYTAGWTQGNTSRPWSPTHARFIFRDNLTLHGDSGVTGASTSIGVDTLDAYFPGSVFERNVLVGGDGSLYPPNSFFPASVADVGFVDLARGNYRLAASSPYKNAGTGGTDIGADIDAIEAAVAGVVDGLDTTAPTVSISSPTAGATFGGTVAVSASASDNAGVAGVQFKLDGANLDAEDTAVPYTISWDTTTSSNGSYTLTAVARDAAGNRTTSAPVTVTVLNDTTPPVVAVTSPAHGATVSATITVAASASDNVGVVRAELLVDGNLIESDTTVPYEVAWDTRTMADGTHQLTARAHDAAGNVGTSAPVTVTVANGAAPPPPVTRFEETEPSVTYTAGWTHGNTGRTWSGGTAAPSSMAGAQATFTFTGTSVSWIGFRGPSGGIASVLLDGVFVTEVDTFSPTEEIRAIVFTRTGLADTTHTFRIEVRGRTNAPSGLAFIVVDAFDVPAPAVTRVQETDPSVTYTVDWTQGTTAAAWSGGTAALSLTAGARATFTFNGTSVRWIGYRGPSGGIAQVSLDGIEVDVDTFHLADEVQADVFTRTALDATTHILTIEVTGRKNAAADNALVVVDAFEVTSSLTPDTAPPVVAISSPADGATVAATTTVAGSASDNVGVVRVEFLVDGALIGSDTTVPYDIAWDARTVADGTHQLTARAHDAAGNVGTSAPVTVTVANGAPPPPPPPVTRFEETESSVTYTAGWTHGNTGRTWSGGTAALSSIAGAQATLTFIGTSVSWLGFRGPSGGIASVSLDGVFVTELDTFSTTEEVRAVVFRRTGLADGTHTLTIEVTGRTNAPSGLAFVVVDAFDVPAPAVTRVQETDPSITYTSGSIQGNTALAWSGGTAALLLTAGAQATVTFGGTSVTWIGFRGPSAGIAHVFLDEVFQAEIDMYSTTGEVQAIIFTKTGLAATTHTLTIEVTGQKNAAADNNIIAVDAFDVTS